MAYTRQSLKLVHCIQDSSDRRCRHGISLGLRFEDFHWDWRSGFLASILGSDSMLDFLFWYIELKRDSSSDLDHATSSLPMLGLCALLDDLVI